MELEISNIDDIKKYNPYVDLAEFRKEEYFEDKFLEYLDNFRKQVDGLKKKLGSKSDKKIDKLFNNVIRNRNDEEIKRILDEYVSRYTENGYSDIENEIASLRKRVRTVKDMILISESSNMKRLQKIDDKVGDTIDEISICVNMADPKLFDGVEVNELLNKFKISEAIDLESYNLSVLLFRKKIEEIHDYYRNNYSVKTATKYIKKLKTEVDKVLEDNAIVLENFVNVKEEIAKLVQKYKDRDVNPNNFYNWVDNFKIEINNMHEMFKNIYSQKMARKMIEFLEEQVGDIIDKKADSVGMDNLREEKLHEIFVSYRPDKLDIFDMIFYSSEEERDKAREKYKWMTSEQKKVFEMRIYEQYIRLFKGKIRDLNKNIRRVYSSKYANKLVNSVNKRADKLIRDKAKEIGKPVPKNPWIIRKYLWADTTNFMSDNGVKFRKFINPLLSGVVRLAMKNKLIIEERAKLDSTKEYIFVSTHYFTEDVIGLFSSLGRQAYMLMGTTDQIENNPLMLAAVGFGFFHVDRMDKTNRKDCLIKQNRIIDHGTSFINYVSGSWENSENELQPLSFSGPYRTSVAKNVEIVPIASYLVREKKEIYVRYGEPLDLREYDEETANMIIRDTLASMHFKQISSHSIPIRTIGIEGYGRVHNLSYDQHIYYMDQIGNEYWNQPWSKPFAEEEIGLRPKKVTDEEDVYSFVDNLSRDKLIELSTYLAKPMLRRYERDERYNIVKYIDENYDRFKSNGSRCKVRKRVKVGK